MILVTGGTGLAGHFIVQELRRRSYDVRMLVRPNSLAKVTDADVEIAAGDLADPDSMRRAAKDVAGIVHAACTFTTSAVDIAAMQVLLDSWRQGPFVFISSLDVYGFADTMPITEEHQLSETYSDYGRSKVVCERLLEAWARMSGRRDYAMLRAAYIWGPHPAVYARFVRRPLHQLRQGEPIVPVGDIDAWIDARDLAWIAAECLERPPGAALNALSGHFTWPEVYAELIRLTGSSSSLESPSNGRVWDFSNSRLREQLGYQPHYSLAATLKDMLLLLDGDQHPSAY